MKTADLERSKRLKELGAEQGKSIFVYDYRGICLLRAGALGDAVSFWTDAPTTGEMIGRNPWGALHNKAFLTKDGLCNALADSVIWVLEMK